MNGLEGGKLEIWVLLGQRAQFPSFDHASAAFQRQYVNGAIDDFSHLFDLLLELIVRL